ncbi:hypothetical protein KSP39_PZI015410 [Platanthera zijinensis]|uniref:Uncharacterized protein n=1 Tax=Platanthera zijinensis TaxID=2320716 RepID=A0AAP0B8J0_9ASPA
MVCGQIYTLSRYQDLDLERFMQESSWPPFLRLPKGLISRLKIAAYNSSGKSSTDVCCVLLAANKAVENYCKKKGKTTFESRGLQN